MSEVGLESLKRFQKGHWLPSHEFPNLFLKIFHFASGIYVCTGFPLSTLRFSTLLHNDPAAQQDHCGSCRIRTRDHRPRSLVRYLSMSHHAHLLEFLNYVQLLSVAAVNSTVAQSEKFVEIGSGKLNAGYKKNEICLYCHWVLFGESPRPPSVEGTKEQTLLQVRATDPSPCPLPSPPPPA